MIRNIRIIMITATMIMIMVLIMVLRMMIMIITVIIITNNKTVISTNDDTKAIDIHTHRDIYIYGEIVVGNQK